MKDSRKSLVLLALIIIAVLIGSGLYIINENKKKEAPVQNIGSSQLNQDLPVEQKTSPSPVKAESAPISPVSSKPFLKVVIPKGGETFRAGQTVNIEWESGNFSPTSFKISLERKLPTDTQYWNVTELAKSLPASGSFSWTINLKDFGAMTLDSTGHQTWKTPSGLPNYPADASYKLLISEFGEKGTELVAESKAFTISQ